MIFFDFLSAAQKYSWHKWNNELKFLSAGIQHLGNKDKMKIFLL